MNTEIRSRLSSLKKLLGAGELGTQDELVAELEAQGFQVTQSTISRDLRKLGAVRAIDAQGRTVYRLSVEPAPTVAPTSLRDLISDIQSNAVMIVIHTAPGSASLIARHLDQVRPAGILGTIAGDDTIFVAPAVPRSIKQAIRAIEQCLESNP